MERFSRLHVLCYPLAAIWIAAGLLANPWLLARLLSPDGTIDNPLFLALIGLFELALLGLGLLTILFARRLLVLKLNLLLVSLLLFSPLAAELAFRVAIAAGVPQFRNPAWYANFYTDDLYWKLKYLWNPASAPAEHRIHPRLGWSQTAVTEENPLGLQSNTLARLQPDGRKKILVYGDSFIKGAADEPYEIPRYLDVRLPDHDVLDLGVGGYGTDQIYLMFSATRARAPDALILYGTFLTDMDRAVLRFRGCQKPVLQRTPAGELAVSNTPVVKDQLRYVRRELPGAGSYFFRFLKGKLGAWTADRAAVERVNAEITAEVAATARRENLRLIYVLYYNLDHFGAITWREAFLKQQLDKHGLPYLDTKTYLLEHAAAHGLQLDAFYDLSDGHHNNLGNQVISDGILNDLRKRGSLAVDEIEQQGESALSAANERTCPSPAPICRLPAGITRPR